MKKIISLFLILLVVFSFSIKSPINASSDYKVVEYNESGDVVATLKTFSSFADANAERRRLGRSRNYAVTLNNKIMAINYGVVNLNTSSLAELNNYSTVEETTKTPGYINGAYGADAMYLGTMVEDSEILIRIGGGNFTLYKKNSGFEAEILPYSNKLALSRYRVEGTNLNHYISTNVNKLSEYSIDIAPAPSYLKPNVTYYSYDGHYFYTDYKVMVNDLVEEHFNNAVNAGNPFYNYYQFLPYRSQTVYSETEFSNYFYKQLTLDKPYNGLISVLNGTEKAFLESQEIYGANAILTFAIARNESADGYSYIAQQKKNLFGHGAVDSSPYAGASQYTSNSSSIYEHASLYVSQIYAHVGDTRGRYFGSHVGDKISGMNVKYASDPYWGEKAARNYYRFDRMYGLKDYQRYTIGIQKDNAEVFVYANAGDDNPIFSLKTVKERPFTIIGSTTVNNELWYKIHPDSPLNSDRTNLIPYLSFDGKYSFNSQYAYVKASVFKHVINGKTGTTVEIPTPPVVIPSENIEGDTGSLVSKVNSLLETSNSNEFLTDVKLGSDVSLVANQKVNNTSIVVKSSEGNTKTSGVFKTGDKVQFVNNGKVVKELSVVILGDANQDGEINVRDTLAVYRHIMNIRQLSSAALKAADSNLDNEINVRDTLAIYRHIMNIRILR